MAWIDLTQDLTTKGRKELNIGQVLIFSYEGSPVYLKIMAKRQGKIWAKRLNPDKFLKPEEADEQVTVIPKK